MSFADRSTLQVVACVALAAATTLVAPSARADGDKALAESLFQAGRTLMEQHEYAQACPKFEDSQRQDPSPGTLLNLGECYEALGRTASAWAEYQAAASMARARGRSEQEQSALDHSKRIAPRLSKLEIDAPASAVTGMVVRRDAVDVGTGSLGVAVAVDPGSHRIEVSAPGYKPWSTSVDVGKEAALVRVAIPALEPAPAAATLPPGTATSPTPSPAPATHDVGTGGSTRTLGFVVGGAGVVVIGVGAVFGVLASKQASDAKNDPALCPNEVCTPAGRSEIDSAKSKALISTIGVGVGAAALVTGAVLVFTAHPSAPAQARSSSPRLVPSVGAGFAGLALLGGFE